MKTIGIGIDNFENIIRGDLYYVDKTKVIEELITKQKFGTILFPRPRRFGKSLMISMLDNFFNIEKSDANKDLFQGLYISKSDVYESNLNKYPVIKLNFKETKCDTFDSFLNNLKSMISDLYTEKSYVKEKLNENELKEYEIIENKTGSIDDFKLSIKRMTKWLERKYNQKVIVLFDEYDAPISEAYVKGFYDEVMSVIKPIFSSTLKDNDSLKFGVLTGILRVSRESMFSDFNNPKIYDIMTPGYNEYFGFTKEETEELLGYYGLEYNDEIKDYYDGYNFNGLHIYNPWSILNYAQDKQLKPYWANTSSNLLIKQALSGLRESDRTQIEKLVQGESISFVYDDRLTYKDFDNPNLGKALNLLLVSGYMTFDKEDINNITGNTKTYFKIPNTEVKNEMIRIIQEISFGGTLSDIKYYENFLESLILGKKEDVEKFLNETLNGTSFYDIKKEYAYEMYLSGLFGGLMNRNFIVKSNRESGTGRSDILIEKVDRSVGVVIEIKVVKTEEDFEEIARIAKTQIKNKDYYKELVLDKVKEIHEYAIVFHEKTAIVR